MKTKLASRLPIQQMIADVISSATEKIAEDQSARSQKVRDLLAYEKQEHGHIPTPAEEAAEKTKTASYSGPAYIEKLASAVEAIVSNFENIEFPHKGILQKAAESEGSPQGPGKGEGALEVTMTSRGGTQNYNTGHAHNTEASSSKAHTSLSGSHEGDGKTQLENDLHHAPGGGSIAPTAKYPPKGPLVSGPTTKQATVQQIYEQAVLDKAAAPSMFRGQENGFLRKRHQDNGAIYNLDAKDKAAQAIRSAVIQKLAGEDVMKANIEAERSANPLAGMGQLQSFDSTVAPPQQSGNASGGGFGNQGRRLIASNQAAIDATKGDAKGPVKTQLSEILEEPALSSSTDPVLENNLQNTGKAGVKIAAARATLEKVAQQGCSCTTIDGECAFCRIGTKVAAATQRKKGSTKVANAMMGYGGGSPSAGSSMGGGGMMSMADAGAGADGCQCGNTGECRICKLKAALAAAKAGSGGAGMPGGVPGGLPSENGSPGAAPAGAY